MLFFVLICKDFNNDRRILRIKKNKIMKILVFLTVLTISFSITKAQEALPINSKAPLFSATTTQDKVFDLSEVIKEKQVVLMFYRGQWCPHCNKQLSELQDSLKYINELGATVIAITPEKPEEIDKTVEKTSASFNLIYDEGHRIMDLYKVTFTMPKAKHALYKTYGVDINKASGNDDRALPVPATYIINKHGKITGSFFDDNYKKRASVKQILEILKQ